MRVSEKLPFKSVWTVEHRRSGVLLAKQEFENASVDEGIANLFNAGFGGGSVVNPWYIGLVNNSPTPTLLTTDTLASHSGWTEFSTYTGNRQEWVDAATASRIKGTTSSAVFAITGTVTVYGMFLCSAATGSSGTLFSEGAFSSTISAVNGDTINASYSIQA